MPFPSAFRTSSRIFKLVVDLRTHWPHHIYKGLYRKWIGAVDLNSFVFRIFRVSPFNSKILGPWQRISLIPKDRGGGGVPFNVQRRSHPALRKVRHLEPGSAFRASGKGFRGSISERFAA